MPTIIRSVPAGYDWGWFSREDPRMHLQTLHRPKQNSHKIWLERDGNRVFEPEGKVPGSVLRKLEPVVAKERLTIEDFWVMFMIENQWIRLVFTKPIITVTAYPRFPGKFTRTIDLTEWFRPETLAELEADDIGLNAEMGSIELFKKRIEQRRHDIRLSRILWQ